MADISSFTDQIREASRGEIVRDAIIKALVRMRDDGVNAKALQGKTVDWFATVKQMNQAFETTHKMNSKEVYAKEIKKGSMFAVQSSVIYSCFDQLNRRFNELLGEDDN